MTFKIKDAWFVSRMERANADGDYDMNAVNTLLEARRNLPKLYITLTDG
jgi:hypothetical protein